MSELDIVKIESEGVFVIAGAESAVMVNDLYIIITSKDLGCYPNVVLSST
jgi:hypothetical protein